MRDTRRPAGRLINVCGLPGSGKTTRATHLAAELEAVRYSSDDWLDALALDLWDATARNRVEALQWIQAQELLARGLVVVIEWGTWTQAERERMRTRATELGARTEIHVLDEHPDELYRRIAARDRERPPITRSDVYTWLEIFQHPTPEELARYDVAVS